MAGRGAEWLERILLGVGVLAADGYFVSHALHEKPGTWYPWAFMGALAAVGVYILVPLTITEMLTRVQETVRAIRGNDDA